LNLSFALNGVDNFFRDFPLISPLTSALPASVYDKVYKWYLVFPVNSACDISPEIFFFRDFHGTLG